MTTAFKYEEAAAKGKGIISLLCLRSYGLNCSYVRSVVLSLEFINPWGSFEGSLVHLALSVSRRGLLTSPE